MKTLERVVIALLDECEQTECWEKNYNSKKRELTEARAEIARLQQACQELSDSRTGLQKRLEESHGQITAKGAEALRLIQKRIDGLGGAEAQAIYRELSKLFGGTNG